MKTKSKFIFTFIAPIFIFAIFFSFLLVQKAQAVNSSMPVLQIPIPDIKIPGQFLKFSDPKECVAGELDKNGNKTLCIPWLGEYITGLTNYAMGIVSILAVVVMMFGGIVWLTAGGNQTQITSAKAWIGASLTGLVIAFSSYLILYTVNPNLTVFNPIKVAVIQKAPETTSTTGCGWETSQRSGDTVLFCKTFFKEADSEDKCPAGEKQPSTTCCCPTVDNTKSGLRTDIAIKDGVNVSNLQPVIVSEINSFDAEFGKKFTITSGTEGEHKNDGENTHAGGFKVDIRISEEVNKYIESSYTKIDHLRKDGATMYQNKRGACYAYEEITGTGPHWDITTNNCP